LHLRCPEMSYKGETIICDMFYRFLKLDLNLVDLGGFGNAGFSFIHDSPSPSQLCGMREPAPT
jgi:hypothetical protein